MINWDEDKKPEPKITRKQRDRKVIERLRKQWETVRANEVRTKRWEVRWAWMKVIEQVQESWNFERKAFLTEIECKW